MLKILFGAAIGALAGITLYKVYKDIDLQMKNILEKGITENFEMIDLSKN